MKYPNAIQGSILITPSGSGWLVKHVVKSSRAMRMYCCEREAAIDHARDHARAFNTTLFIEEDGKYRELPVEDNDVDQNLLGKVRKIIAKAERTDFESERDAFLAKAQELMIRHALDESMVKEEIADHQMIERHFVVGNRGAGLWAKRDVITTVAGYANCRTWAHTRSYYSTVAGFAEDVEFADMLITSLLLQMEREVGKALKHDKPEWTDPRTYRVNFMEAFASSISARLTAMKAQAQTRVEEDSGSSVALVLRDRKERVNEWVDAKHHFVTVSRNQLKGFDGAARQAGARAGERADLSNRRSIGRTAIER